MKQKQGFSPQVIAGLKERADIVSAVSRYVQLKKAGQNFQGLCPFHSEKSPSFNVSPHRQMYHCFGCGEGGDIFSFLMKIEHIGFYDALKMVAEDTGYTLPRLPSSGKNRKEYATEHLIEKACSFYQKNLAKHRGKLEGYLAKRELSSDTVQEFRLGYAGDGWHELSGFLGNLASEKECLETGLVKKNRHGLYDLLRNRLVFPIENLRGKVVAFGGRILADGEEAKGQPKYLNTPESALFKKGQILYGMNRAVEFARKEPQLIVVEGYMDVISLHARGIRNVVAVLGTSLSEEHVKLIRRYWEEVVLLFDGDNAGIRAAERSFLLLTAGELKVKGLILPKGEDPDSAVRKESDAFKTLIAQAGSFVSALARFLRFQQGKKGREITGRVFPLLRSLASPLARADGLRDLAEVTGYREQELLEEFSRFVKREDVISGSRQRGAFSQQEQGQQVLSPSETVARKARRNILGAMLLEKSYRVRGSDEVGGMVSEEKGWSRAERELFSFLVSCRVSDPLSAEAEMPADLQGLATELDFRFARLQNELKKEQRNEKEDFLENLYKQALQILRNIDDPHVPRKGKTLVNEQQSEKYRLLQEQLKQL